MSRTDARRWLALGLAAFALRAGLAIMTEYISIFPLYYYHDARLAETVALRGPEAIASYPFPQRAHARLIAAVFAVYPHPLAAKLVNSALGASAVVLFGLALRALFSPATSFLAACFVAAWPSHVFYTSQNFRESAAFLLLFAGFVLVSTRRTLAIAGAAAPLTAAAAMYPAAAVGLAGASALAAWSALPSRRAAILSLACAGTLLAVGIGRTGALQRVDSIRRLRQAQDREYAAKFSGPTLSPSRLIGTQIEPDARIDTWSGLLRYAPKAAFTVLFQPFPGLYPLEGKLGRRLAAVENLLLFALTVAAAFGMARLTPSPGRAGLLGFFLASTAAATLFEFDLGSASRHKLLYLPMLFPFATEEILRWRRA